MRNEASQFIPFNNIGHDCYRVALHLLGQPEDLLDRTLTRDPLNRSCQFTPPLPGFQILDTLDAPSRFAVGPIVISIGTSEPCALRVGRRRLPLVPHPSTLVPTETPALASADSARG